MRFMDKLEMNTSNQLTKVQLTMNKPNRRIKTGLTLMAALVQHYKITSKDARRKK